MSEEGGGISDESGPRASRVIVTMDDPGSPTNCDVILVDGNTVTNDEAIAIARAQRAPDLATEAPIEAGFIDAAAFEPLRASDGHAERPVRAPEPTSTAAGVHDALDLGLAASPEEVLAAANPESVPPTDVLDEAVSFGPVVPLEADDPRPVFTLAGLGTRRRARSHRASRRKKSRLAHRRTRRRRGVLGVIILSILAIAGMLLVSPRSSPVEADVHADATTPSTGRPAHGAAVTIETKAAPDAPANPTATGDPVVDPATGASVDVPADASRPGMAEQVPITVAAQAAGSTAPATGSYTSSRGTAEGPATSPAPPSGPPAPSDPPPATSPADPPPTSPPPPPPPPPTTAPTTTQPLRTTTTTTTIPTSS